MKRLEGFDGIRAVACLMVVAHHLFQKIDSKALSPSLKELQRFFLFGNLGVSAFFVLSGALLALPFWHHWLSGNALPSIQTYAMRRFARIAPGFYFSLTISLLLSITLFNHTLDAQLWLRFITGLTFINSFHWVTFFPSESNGPLWSIGFEVICYFLLVPFMALMFYLFRRREIKIAISYWLAVLLSSLSLHVLITHYVHIPDEGRGWEFGLIGGAKVWMPLFNPVGLFCHFLMGMIAAGILIHLQNSHSKKSRLFDLTIILTWVLTGLLLLQSGGNPDGYHEFAGNIFFWPWFPLAVAVSLVCLPFSEQIGKCMDNRLFRYIAKISFGLYIWHYLIMEVLRQTLFQDYVYMGYTNLTDWLSPTLFTLALSIIIASFSYYFVEQPARAWIQKREIRPSLIASGNLQNHTTI
jgi:peptidoglycan/LPS O-acetylase OafA/YrhL